MKSTKPDLAAFHHQVLMDDMMEVVGVDLLDVVDVDGGQSYLQARSNCHGCPCKASCRDWLMEQRRAEPQDFCPNADLFRTVKKRHQN